MQRLVYFTGERYHVRDAAGRWYHTSTPELYATAAEIREARRQYESAQYPLPQYDADSGLYYWDDPSDLWSEDEIADDVRKIWPGMDADVLLESSRLMAKLGIKD